MRLGSKEIDVKNQKKVLRSIWVDSELWKKFDETIEKEFGHYKKGLVIEHLIRDYMTNKK